MAYTSSPVWYRLYSTSRLGASRESVMVGNRGPIVEGHHSLTTCFTNLLTNTARYITTAPHFPKPFTSNRFFFGARYLIKSLIN